MSLFKQLLLAMIAFLFLNFLGEFVIALIATKGQQIEQLEATAQETANVLSLALQPNMDDPALIEAQVNSMFDNGYYARITLTSLADNSILLDVQSDHIQSKAPSWFVQLVQLNPATGESIVTNGWKQIAKLEVKGHPVFAIDKLWETTWASFLWLSAIAFMGVLFAAWLLKRQLKPLVYMEQQARAISRREFLSAQELPATPELRPVVNAMNQMVDKLRSLFTEQATHVEHLRKEAYFDDLTGLGNRRYFDLKLGAFLSQDEEATSGYLLIMLLKDLSGMNQSIGPQRADQLLQAIGLTLFKLQEEQRERGAIAVRNRGAEFAILLPGMEKEEAEVIAKRLLDECQRLLADTDLEAQNRIFMGLVPFKPGDEPAQLMNLADESISMAHTQGAQEWVMADRDMIDDGLTARHAWYQTLESAIQKNWFELYTQPVLSCQDGATLLHQKILARMQEPGGRLLTAGRFLPWIERFGWSHRFDLQMLQSALQSIKDHPQKHFALSISGQSLRDTKAFKDLLAMAADYPNEILRLTIDLHEDHMPDQTTMESRVRQLHAQGMTIGLQHFGGRLGAMSSLANLGLAHLKIDGAYIRNLNAESDKRLVLEAISKAAHSIDLPLMAERVETMDEWRALQVLKFEGIQGMYFAQPVKFDPI